MPVNRIQKELQEQPVIISQKESYYLAAVSGEKEAVLTLDTISAPYMDKVNYFCMYHKSAGELLNAFFRFERKECLSLYYGKR